MFQLARSLRDVVGAAVDAVDRGQHFGLVDNGQFNILFDQPRDLVVREQVGRVGQANQQAAAAVFQDQRAETARLGFRQQAHQFRVNVVELQVDERDIQLARQRARDLFFGNKAVLDEHPAQLAAGSFLLGQRHAQLFFG